MAKRGTSTKRVLEYARLAMGFADVRAGTRVLMLVLVQAWPVDCTNFEANAFCAWKRAKTGQHARLPTEAEVNSMRGAPATDGGPSSPLAFSSFRTRITAWSADRVETGP